MSHKYCPQCGDPIQSGSDFCGLCGFQFSRSPKREEMNAQTKVEFFSQPENAAPGAQTTQTQSRVPFTGAVIGQIAPEIKPPANIKYAENGDRFLAFIIDSMIINAIAALVFHNDGFFLASSGLTILYFALSEMIGNGSGQTLGKRALKIKTVDENTLGPLTISQAFIHSLGKTFFGLIDLIVGSILNDRDKEGGAPDKLQVRLTQRLAHTVVIKVE